MKIIVTAANSQISIAISKILKSKLGTKLKVVGIAPDGVYPAQFFFDQMYSIPHCSHPNYLPDLKKIIAQEKCQILIPVSDAENIFLSDKKEVLDTIVLINEHSLINTFSDKLNTNHWLREHGLPALKTEPLVTVESSHYPLMLKERRGAGSKGLYHIKSAEELSAIKKYLEVKNSVDTYIAQQFVGDASGEFTCALWRFNGDYREIILKRKLIVGITSEAEVVADARISSLLVKISEIIQGDFFINVQLRLEGDVPFIFEINPRFSSTIRMRHLLGFKDLEWSVDALLGNVIAADFQIANAKVFRIFTESLLEAPNK